MSNFNKLIDRFDRMFLYFIDKIISPFDKPTRKFYIDIVYGILKSQSIILSDIAHELNEDILPKKTIERLSRFLDKNFDLNCRDNLLSYAISIMPKKDFLVFSVDDSDVTKPYGKHFESLGKVKDGSAIKTTIEKGYRVSCITALTSNSKHPMPIYDVFHSEAQPDFKSVNDYTFAGLEFVCSKVNDYSAVFVFDRGYDDYKIFNFFASHKQYFVVRMTKNRKIIIKNKKVLMIAEGKRKKGKIIIPVTYKGNKTEIKASHIRVRLIKGKQEYSLIYSYMGEAKEPSMFLTNRPINSKDDVISVVMNYASRWKIEEQFRFKKNGFNFEDFRVRSLNRINNLTLCLDIAITFMSSLIEYNSELYQYLISISKSLKNDAYIKYYQLLSGIKTLLGHKEMGIKNKEKVEHRSKVKQLSLF